MYWCFSGSVPDESFSDKTVCYLLWCLCEKHFNFPPVSSFLVGASTFGDQKKIKQVALGSFIPLILPWPWTCPRSSRAMWEGSWRCRRQQSGEKRAHAAQRWALLPNSWWNNPLADWSTYLQRKKRPGRGVGQEAIKKLFLTIYFLKWDVRFDWERY